MKLKLTATSFILGLVLTALGLLFLVLTGCTHTKKSVVKKDFTTESTNVTKENSIDISNHIEDSSNINTKSIDNNTDSSNTKTVTLVFDQDTSGKQTEISINVDSNGTVYVKTNKPVKSVNSSQKQANKKQEKKTEINASSSKKADTNIKASDKNDSTNKKTVITEETTNTSKWKFPWFWVIVLGVSGVCGFLAKSYFKRS